jgi:hypothetical protein
LQTQAPGQAALPIPFSVVLLSLSSLSNLVCNL